MREDTGLALRLCMVAAMVCCRAGAALGGTAPNYTVLPAFENYIDRLPVPVGKARPVAPLGADRPQSGVIYQASADSLVAVFLTHRDRLVVVKRYDVNTGRHEDIKDDCGLANRWELMVDGRLPVLVQSENGLSLLWLDRDRKVQGCRVGRDNKITSLDSVTSESPVVPVGAVFESQVNASDSEGIAGWRGAFRWFTSDGSEKLKGNLPDGLVAVGSPPLSLRLRGSTALWALRSFRLADDPRPGDDPATDLSILSLANGGCSLAETIRAKPIPVSHPDEWVVESTLDSPVWLGTSNALAYRCMWSAMSGVPPYQEELRVWELRQHTVGGGDVLLDLFAYYQGPGRTQYYWTVNDKGEIEESILEHKVLKGIPQIQLAPFPTETGSILYVRNDKIYTVKGHVGQ